MITTLKRLRSRAADLLGLDQMDARFNILAANYVFLMMYYTLESVFVNTLLYRISPEMGIVIRYRAVVFLFTAVSVNVAAYFCKRFSPVLVIRLAGLSYILMYILLFVGLDHMDRLMYPVAILSGSGIGFYFGGHNMLLTQYTNRANRAMGVSILGVAQGAMTLLVPVVSGFVISLLPGNAGYRTMFGIGMLVVLLQGRLQKKLAPVEQKKKTSELKLALKLIWRKSTCKMMLAFEIVRGFRDGTFAFFLNMVLFEIITQESLVGINTFFTGIMTIFGSWAYGKMAGPGKRVGYALLSTTILLAGCVSMFWFASAATVMIFSAVNAFAHLFIGYTANTFSFDVMSQNETMRRCLAEMSALRESAITLGRLAGLFVLTLFPDTLEGYVWAMCVLTVSQYLAVWLIKLTKDTLDRKQVKRISKIN